MSLEHDKYLREKAIAGFVFRKTHLPTMLDADQSPVLTIPLDIRNDRLYAGSAMIYYCKHCGWPSDIKHEEHFLAGYRDICNECEVMFKYGWLADAEDAARRFSAPLSHQL